MRAHDLGVLAIVNRVILVPINKCCLVGVISGSNQRKNADQHRIKCSIYSYFVSFKFKFQLFN